MFKFLSNDVWTQGAKLLEKRKPKTAAISYVTIYSTILNKNDVLICDASEAAIECGETKASVLRTYMDKGVKIFSVPNFHAKLIVCDNGVIIGSANLSKNSATKLVEASVYTNEISAIAQAHAFCHPFISKKFELTELNLVALEQIVPIERKDLHRNVPKERKRTFRGDEWVISTVPGKSEKYVDEIERLEKVVAKKYNTIADNIDTLTWKPNGKFAIAAKLGNTFIRIHTEGRRTSVYSEATLVQIERKPDCTLLLYKLSEDNTFLSWTEFKKKTKELMFAKNIGKKSCRRISTVNFQLLRDVFNE